MSLVSSGELEVEPRLRSTASKSTNLKWADWTSVVVVKKAENRHCEIQVTCTQNVLQKGGMHVYSNYDIRGGRDC